MHYASTWIVQRRADKPCVPVNTVPAAATIFDGVGAEFSSSMLESAKWLLVVGCFSGVKPTMIVIGLYHKAIVNR